MTHPHPGGPASRPIDAATSGQDQPLSAVDVSQLVAVTLRLAMEVGALRERLRTHEALLVQHGVLPAGAVESFAPSAEEVQSRLTEHRNLIEAVVRDLQHR
ncbi:MAG: hypothetical protein EB021_08160 [Gammaproteobacteria bacterium]|nr:hypothetical protein [Gammaproteobacteria bacterium]